MGTRETRWRADQLVFRRRIPCGANYRMLGSGSHHRAPDRRRHRNPPAPGRGTTGSHRLDSRRVFHPDDGIDARVWSGSMQTFRVLYLFLWYSGPRTMSGRSILWERWGRSSRPVLPFSFLGVHSRTWPSRDRRPKATAHNYGDTFRRGCASGRTCSLARARKRRCLAQRVLLPPRPFQPTVKRRCRTDRSRGRRLPNAESGAPFSITVLDENDLRRGLNFGSMISCARRCRDSVSFGATAAPQRIRRRKA